MADLAGASKTVVVVVQAGVNRMVVDLAGVSKKKLGLYLSRNSQSPKSSLTP